MATNLNYFEWEKFWQQFPEDPDEIKDIEELIFRNNSGTWVAIFAIPNSKDVVDCAVYYNPWTGEKLQ